MPKPKDHVVAFTADERARLTRVVSRGTHPARTIMRARVLLELDENPVWCRCGGSSLSGQGCPSRPCI